MLRWNRAGNKAGKPERKSSGTGGMEWSRSRLATVAARLSASPEELAAVVGEDLLTLSYKEKLWSSTV